MKTYDHKKIEKKWQKVWEGKKLYKTENSSRKKKMYILDMFPYPSAEGLHVGHPRGYIATDIYSRMKKMQGYNVLHPMGWDAFGLPAENFAIKNKIHPSLAVKKNVKRFKEQLSVIGFNYDWSREINTTDPAFYKWTQWIFLQMYKKGLAYESFEPINWCPECKTGLANEDVESDGTCERCGTVVEKKPMRQWVLKITDYADRMLTDLDKLPKWPEGVKEAQRNWIGRSEGSEIEFKIKNSDQTIKVFTTRADTLFGATYVVLAPEHELIKNLNIENKKEVEDYIRLVKNKTEIERTENKEKTGVETKGIKAINPANNEEIPVWIADYVIAGYGTGAVMAVPAHDERDFEFAKKYNLPIKEVIAPFLNIIDGEFGYRNEKEIIERKGILAIVKHWEKDEYLILESKKHGWKTFVIGGIEKGEDVVEAAKREIIEETGFSDLKFIKKLGGNIFAKHFVPHKDENRFAELTGFYFELQSEKSIPVADHELELQKVLWIKKNEIVDTLKPKITDWVFWQRLMDLNNSNSAFINDGVLVNSEKFNNLTSEEARKKITKIVSGKIVTKYKIKDWVFSRQRYWGEPIPIIHCEKCGVVPVPEKDLPIILPKVKSYEPTGTGESPLANISSWVNVKCPKCKSPAKRETNTMPQWAGSSWYYLRFIDPKNKKALVDKKKEKYFSPVDVYVGGDHATRHLIYARFWHKFLYDIKAVSYEEPFPRLEFLGFILAEDGRKMSKRWKNVVNPDDMVKQFGADAFRLYEMFIGPFESTAPWNTNGLVGTYRFIERVWKLKDRVINNKNEINKNSKVTKLVHKMIKKVEEDIEAFKFNTAVSSLMIFVNEISKEEFILKEDFKNFLQILAPFAPHVAEELWVNLGDPEGKSTSNGAGKKSIHTSDWPKYNKNLIKDDEVKIVIQVNGKVRAEMLINVEETEEKIKEKALSLEQVLKYTESSNIRKVIYVKKRLINIVI